MRRGFKSWAEAQALAYRRALHLEPEATLRATHLASHLKIAIVGPEQIPGMTPELLHHLLHTSQSSWSAITLVIEEQTLIIHNTSHAETRQESNLMHDLGHVICNHKPVGFQRVEGLPFLLRGYDPVQEEEAAWIGGCLQLPRPALCWAVSRGMTEMEMVQYFHASRDLIRFRRRMTGVDRQFARVLPRA